MVEDAIVKENTLILFFKSIRKYTENLGSKPRAILTEATVGPGVSGPTVTPECVAVLHTITSVLTRLVVTGVSTDSCKEIKKKRKTS